MRQIKRQKQHHNNTKAWKWIVVCCAYELRLYISFAISKSLKNYFYFLHILFCFLRVCCIFMAWKNTTYMHGCIECKVFPKFKSNSVSFGFFIMLFCLSHCPPQHYIANIWLGIQFTFFLGLMSSFAGICCTTW